MENIYENGTAKEFYRFVAKNKSKLYDAYRQLTNNLNADIQFDKLLAKYDLFLFISNPNNLSNFENRNKKCTSYHINCYAYAVFGINDQNMPYWAPEHDDIFCPPDSSICLDNNRIFKKSFLKEMTYYGVKVSNDLAGTQCSENSWVVARYLKAPCDFHFARQTNDGLWVEKPGYWYDIINEYYYRPDLTIKNYRYIDDVRLTPGGVPGQEILDMQKLFDQFEEKI